jgi:predicted deacetylase
VDVVASGLAADVRAEELVGEEEHLAFGWYRRDDLHRVRRCAAHVRLGFDLRAGVDIRHHDRAGVLSLPLAELIRGDRIRERAAGVTGRD